MQNKTFKQHRLVYFLFTAPALLFYSFFFVFPVVTGIYYSMTDWNGVSRKYNFIGFGNFVGMFRDERLLNSLLVNLNYIVVIIVVIPCLSLLTALVLNSRAIKFNTFFRSLYFFPAVLSLITVALIWNEIFYRAIPLIGEKIGLEFLTTNILSSKSTAIYGILLVHIWQGLAVPTVLLLAGLQTIPKSLFEAATIDGANAFQKFKSITFPFLIPVLNIILVLTLKAGLTAFDYIKGMTDGGPGGATEVIGILIFRHAFSEMKFSYAITESLLLFVIIAVVSFIQFRFMNKKEVGEQ